MSIKLEDIRVGDKVTLKEGVVTAVRDSAYPISVRAGDETSPSSFMLSSIATHTPAPREFKPGDEVWNEKEYRSTRLFIIATFGAWAWVRDANDWTTQFPLSDLRHADPAPAPQEAGKERKKIEAWVYFYSDGHISRWPTRAIADSAASDCVDRIACLHVEGYEGDGL